MTLAVITPSYDTAWVAGLLPPMRRGVAPVVVLMDAASFGSPPRYSPEEEGAVEAMAALLADLGVPSHRVVQGTPFKPIVEHKRIGRPELKVLRGTGRVILVDG
jgi:hypothetical protein